VPDDELPLADSLSPSDPQVELPEGLSRSGAIDLGADARRRLPGWVFKAVAVFWAGYLAVALVGHLWERLQSLTLLILVAMFLALAIEPGVNRLARRGWRRGSATAVIMFSVVLVVMGNTQGRVL
jgi:hypothetical protein